MRYFKAFLLILTVALVSGQAPQGKLFVLSEGTSTQKGALGVIDFTTKTYTHIDSIASYGNHISYDKDNDYLFVVPGDGNVLVYDIASNQFIDTLSGIGARQTAVYTNGSTKYLLVTGKNAPYFSVYDINNNFAPVSFTLDPSKLRTNCEGIIVVNDKAFLAQQGSYTNFDSTVVVIDLVNKTTDTLLNIQKNPGNLLHINGKIYVQCRDYSTGLKIGIIDLNNNYNVTLVNTGKVSYGGFVNKDDSLILFNYNPNSTTGYIASYSLNTGKIDTNYINAKVYGMTYYKPTQTLFVSTTDYVSYGKVMYYANGSFKDTINTHISPRYLLFVPKNPSSISFVENMNAKILQNPSSVLRIQSEEVIQSVEIYSIAGKLLHKVPVNGLNFSYENNLPQGLYIVKIYGNNKVGIIKWIKQ